jgi:hypothetical protein
MTAGRFLRILAVACLAALPGLSTGQSFEQLLKATDAGDVQAVGGYLGKGLDPDTADRDGNTLLMIAARLGHQDLAAFLISRKASVTRRNPYGDTALMFASLKGHLAVVKLLAANGAEISHAGWTPLHYAAFDGHAEVIKFLLEKGADKDGIAPNGYTPLMLATYGGYVEAARTLLYNDADWTLQGPKGETALRIAKERKLAELEALLRRAGAVD